jgi:hypothetical protein
VASSNMSPVAQPTVFRRVAQGATHERSPKGARLFQPRVSTLGPGDVPHTFRRIRPLQGRGLIPSDPGFHPGLCWPAHLGLRICRATPYLDSMTLKLV